MDIKKFKDETYAYHLRSALARTLSENKKLQDQVEQLKDDLADLESDYDCLEDEKSSMEADRDEYYDNWQLTETKVEGYQQALGDLELDLMDYLDQIDDLQVEIKELKEANEKAVFRVWNEPKS